ncbi:MAG: cbb3-type cytochrome c oxidase subunit II, partial [Verrucomicrobiae bacterium]|nr:cbb3-type cytochrome c oxidase subunit II [Verrucomicrobiae bacterium]
GPHHLLNTDLPRWLQMLGMLFSLMLWAPSWGGMLNGLLTLRGAWDKLRTDPVIKFFAAGVTFYGMATFEGPLLSIRAVNALSHYTDWTIGHVHAGALGWNGFMAAGMFYWLAPRLWKTELWSKGLANMHFWIGTVGILLYVAAMWCAGIMQGLMLNQVNEGGTTLKYEFMETLESIQIFYILRSFGGLLFLIGFVLCAINIWKTARSGAAHDETVEVTLLERGQKDSMRWGEALISDPLTHIFLAMAFVILWFFLPPHADKAALLVSVLLCVKAFHAFKNNKEKWVNWHERLIENYLPFTVLVFVAVAIGGTVQIIPSLVINRQKNVEGRLQELYTPLELAGRDVYVSEGCYNCHSQMIRTLVPEVMRYGRPGVVDDYSHLGESLFDHPYQWGSKRTGPDLAREGGPIGTYEKTDENGNVVKDAAGQPVMESYAYMRFGIRGNDWHYNHFLDPRSITYGSNMPSYPHLFEQDYEGPRSVQNKIAVQQRLGVPWPVMSVDEIGGQMEAQAQEIAGNLVGKVKLPGKDLEGEALRNELAKKKVIALIAYIQKLGAYKEVTPEGGRDNTLDPDGLRKAASTK